MRKIKYKQVEISRKGNLWKLKINGSITVVSNSESCELIIRSALRQSYHDGKIDGLRTIHDLFQNVIVPRIKKKI